ncbi:MAG: tRNA (adenosine(37)-N6)-threonylcarbamoyltransferase complex ATPase subunit type 1 TsaE [Chitinophagaceae bacterium]|nr:tRNA (adenosine(37)-N6)-threonylcarbamoyltransferase complex ATPase subunit type 1 TsaE [Chitinophagaceae bacterium]
MEWLFSLDNINGVAKQFHEAMGQRTVVAFHGPMGAGKTTFIHALCEVMGVKDTVGSPTFSIINEYRYDCAGTPKALFHLDLYRINDEEEAIRAGVEDAFYSGCICLAEWPEKAPGIFPPDTLHVYLSLQDNEKRKLTIADI